MSRAFRFLEKYKLYISQDWHRWSKSYKVLVNNLRITTLLTRETSRFTLTFILLCLLTGWLLITCAVIYGTSCDLFNSDDMETQARNWGIRFKDAGPEYMAAVYTCSNSMWKQLGANIRRSTWLWSLSLTDLAVRTAVVEADNFLHMYRHVFSLQDGGGAVSSLERWCSLSAGQDLHR